MVHVPEDLKYTEEHEWLKIEGNKVRYGITDFAQSELGDIVYIELPMVGDEFEKGEMIGVVESVKTVSDLFSPVTGKVVKVNNALEDTPEIINEKPYSDGWIAVIELAHEDEMKELISAQEYEALVE